ncbi:UNVERIFIED_CONTAM: hypothetical protein Scaly_2941800 [Sesamum calycinum]|uniref:Reverse transcriptase Ty1/copia-type domain-containing protein n=1 Tax=Sesamum calycinum TaxID=2727403 RepID=A0AAW2KXK1_9LAMI
MAFTTKLQDFSFVQSAHDHCLFTKPTDHELMALLVYVDDILIRGPSLTLIQNVKTYLHELFTIKDIGDARYFLGLEISCNSTGTYVSQTKYTMDIIKDTSLSQEKSKTKKRNTVSRSTADAAYRSLAATVYELRWISCILKDFGISLVVPIPLFCDNKAALHILANPVFHECTKHIELDCHLI